MSIWERLKRNPEKEGWKQHLRMAWKTGIQPDSCIGYHGTSIQTVEFVLNHGYLPGIVSTEVNRRLRLAERGDIYFSMDYDAGSSYASIHAACHYFMEQFGLDINNPVHYELASELTDLVVPPEIFTRAVSKLSLNPRKVAKVKREAEKRKGVTLGLGFNIREHFSIVEGDPGEEDWKIRTGNGLPVSFIQGLQPLGVEEERRLKSLLK